jgi:hypothetical protein
MNNIMKKINVLGLTALFAAGGIGLAFNAPQTNLAMVTHGVLSEDNDRYEITQNLAEPHDCGNTEIACTVKFDSDSNVPYLEAGKWYLDKEPGISESGQGPYIPTP